MIRRYFLMGAAVAAAQGLRAHAAQKVRLGIIGCGGRGEGNWGALLDQDVRVLCDVDTARTAAAAKAFPSAAVVQDFRRVLDRSDIDAVVISTPDHWHAIPAAWAMETGKHVYCEKPLTRTVWESQVLRKLAREQKVVTQMGTQIHSGSNYRRVVELIRAGAIGPVSRVEVWCDRKPEPPKLTVGPPPPSTLDYDLWVGPSRYQIYSPDLVPFNWRWWWNFGGGVLADMASHFMDLPHWALDLRRPETVQAVGERVERPELVVPSEMRVDYHYAARGQDPPVHLTWYHGRPGPHEPGGGFKDYGMRSGVLFHGARGQILSDYGRHKLMPEADFAGFERPAQSIPESPGHQKEWIAAIETGGKASCDFSYSGELTETVLLGNVSFRSGRELHWDPKGMTTGSYEADAYLKPMYREPWILRGKRG